MDKSSQSDCALSRPEAERLLSQWQGRPVTCECIKRLHGSGGGTVYRLDFHCPPFCAVAKLDAGPENSLLVRERNNMELVRKLTQVPAPRIYLEDSTRARFPYSVLLLEVLPGTNLKATELTREQRDRVSVELAETMLELHAHTRNSFGPATSGPQRPRWSEVFLPKLAELRDDMAEHLPASALGNIDVALAGARNLFVESGPATLVHGDLWAGNIMVYPEGRHWHLSGLVDWAALQYADVEYELSYLEAWSTVTPSFFEKHATRIPPRAGHETRRLFYWLHTYMLHVWLFGEERYRRLAAETADRIARNLAGGKTT